MFKITVLGVALSIAVSFGGGVSRSSAQETESNKAPAKAAERDKDMGAYRFDFSLNELDNGKKINTRQYSMDLNTAEGRSGDLKIGTRVPIELKQGDINYYDLGTSIYVKIQDRSGLSEPIAISVRGEISNFAVPDQSQNHDSRPILRQLKIDASTLAALGKPIELGSVDDPDSKRTFQLEVVVTKLR
jgi:hypothetical protein